ncbi:MAG: hypothetical protein AB8U44_04305 [Aaplasma endosymbiont of Hyalomma asiaticum]
MRKFAFFATIALFVDGIDYFAGVNMFSASPTYSFSSCPHYENTDSPLFSLQCNASYYSKINIKTLNRRDIFSHLIKVLDGVFVELNDIKCSATTKSVQHIGVEKWSDMVESVRCVVERVLSTLKDIANTTCSSSHEATSLTGIRGVLSPLVVGALFRIHMAYHTLLLVGSVPNANNHIMTRVADAILSLSHVTNVVFTLPLSPVLNTTENDNTFFNTAAVSSHSISASLYHLENIVKRDNAGIIQACNMLIKFTSELLSPYAPKDTMERLRLCSAITVNAAGIVARNTCDSQIQNTALLPAASNIKHTIISSACVHVDIMRGCSQCKSAVSAIHPSASYEELNDHAAKERTSSEVLYLRNSLHLHLCKVLNPPYLRTTVMFDEAESALQNGTDPYHHVRSKAFTTTMLTNVIPSTTLTHTDSAEHGGTHTHNFPVAPQGRTPNFVGAHFSAR